MFFPLRVTFLFHPQKDPSAISCASISALSPKLQRPGKKPSLCVCVALDISKAFDQVLHKNLLAKLPAFGFTPTLLHKWIESFLTNTFSLWRNLHQRRLASYSGPSDFSRPCTFSPPTRPKPAPVSNAALIYGEEPLNIFLATLDTIQKRAIRLILLRESGVGETYLIKNWESFYFHQTN